MSFWTLSGVGPRKHVLDGSLDPPMRHVSFEAKRSGPL